MRRYQVQLRRDGQVVQTEKGISLRAIGHMSGLTAQEVDDIASMQVGAQSLHFTSSQVPGSGILILRTE